MHLYHMLNIPAFTLSKQNLALIFISNIMHAPQSPTTIASDEELISIQTSRKKYHKQTIDTALLDEEITYKGIRKTSIKKREYTFTIDEEPILIQSLKRNISKQTQPTNNKNKKGKQVQKRVNTKMTSK